MKNRRKTEYIVYCIHHIYDANLIVRHEKDTTIKQTGRDGESKAAVNERGEQQGRYSMDVKSKYNSHSLNDGIVTSSAKTRKKNSRTSVCMCACEYI